MGRGAGGFTHTLSCKHNRERAAPIAKGQSAQSWKGGDACLLDFLEALTSQNDLQKDSAARTLIANRNATHVDHTHLAGPLGMVVRDSNY